MVITDIPADKNIGLFGSITGNSLLKNLSLEGPVITIDFSDPSYATDTLHVGGLVGKLNRALTPAELDALKNNLKLNLPPGLPQSVIDALLAEAMAEFTVNTTSRVEGSKVANPAITVKGDNVIAGGMAGMIGDGEGYKGSIKDSYISGGSIKVNENDKQTYDNAWVGAFAGSLSNGAITNSYTTASAEAYVKKEEGVPPVISSEDVGKGFSTIQAYDELPATVSQIVTASFTDDLKENTETGVEEFDSAWPTTWGLYAGDWPAVDSKARAEIITDQRRYADYRQANWMKAEATAENIMPTAAPVPLLFTHEQSRVTYRLAGQNAYGLIIKELLLELDDTRPVVGLGKKGFWAYCGDGTEDPEEIGEGALNVRMILPAGVNLGPYDGGGAGRTRIGLVTVGASGTTEHDYRALIYFPNNTNIKLEPNTDYLVTLTPEGYDLYATISMGGFSQSEGHVAIPFQLPVLNATDNKYEITTVAQLVTISWLLAGDLNGELKSEWETREFDIPAPIVVSAKVQAEGERYLKASVLKSNSTKFSNSDNATYSNGTKVFGE
jgi:hypothetical protein